MHEVLCARTNRWRQPKPLGIKPRSKGMEEGRRHAEKTEEEVQSESGESRFGAWILYL